MGVFYVCDFCPSEEKKMVEHNPEGLDTLFVPHRESGFVICEKCVDFAAEILAERRINARKDEK